MQPIKEPLKFQNSTNKSHTSNIPEILNKVTKTNMETKIISSKNNQQTKRLQDIEISNSQNLLGISVQPNKFERETTFGKFFDTAESNKSIHSGMRLNSIMFSNSFANSNFSLLHLRCQDYLYLAENKNNCQASMSEELKNSFGNSHMDKEMFSKAPGNEIEAIIENQSKNIFEKESSGDLNNPNKKSKSIFINKIGKLVYFRFGVLNYELLDRHVGSLLWKWIYNKMMFH